MQSYLTTRIFHGGMMIHDDYYSHYYDYYYYNNYAEQTMRLWRFWSQGYKEIENTVQPHWLTRGAQTNVCGRKRRTAKPHRRTHSVNNDDGALPIPKRQQPRRMCYDGAIGRAGKGR